MEDNSYKVPDLLPDEYHELFSEYENYVEWAQKSMTEEQKELSGRVLKKLHKADEDHVCLDEVQEGGTPMPDGAKPFLIANLYRTDLGRIGLTREQIAALTNMDMLNIAQRLGARYLESVFLTHLAHAVNELFLEKEQTT